MTNKLLKVFGVTALSCALMSPIIAMAQDHDRDDHHDRADYHDRRYYDKRHKDYHNWDAREDRAYHMYWDQRHRPYVDYDRLQARQQEQYWAWRHNHSDAILNITIR